MTSQLPILMDESSTILLPVHLNASTHSADAEKADEIQTNKGTVDGSDTVATLDGMLSQLESFRGADWRLHKGVENQMMINPEKSVAVGWGHSIPDEGLTGQDFCQHTRY